MVIPLPEDRPSDSEFDGSEDLSDDDVDLLHTHSDALGFLANLPKAAMDREVSHARINAKNPKKDLKKQQEHVKQPGGGGRGRIAAENSDDDEQGEMWERGPRQKSTTQLEVAPKAGPLPIKTLDGQLISDPEKVLGLSRGTFAPVTSIGIAGITIKDDLEDALRVAAAEKNRKRAEAALEAKTAQAELKRQAAVERERKEQHGAPGGGGVLRGLAEYDSIEQRRAEAKEAMAVAAQALLGDPEVQLGKQLHILLNLLADADVQVVRFSMLTLLAVFKDLIPGYRIRPRSEMEQEGVAISKEVKKLWDHETALLKGYQRYLKSLLAALNAFRSGQVAAAHGRVAARCLSSLLVAAPHFNYASDVLQAVVPNMASKDEQIRGHCCSAISELLTSALSAADSGQAALEAVQLVADLVKRRKCVAPPEVVHSLLRLSFPEILSGEDFAKARLARKKKKKKDKKKDDVDKGFKEAQGVVDRDTRRYQQSTILEALFEIYFRVIKAATSSLPKAFSSSSSYSASAGNNNDDEGDKYRNEAPPPPFPASRFAKKFPLLAPVMEGLSKFAHLISIDYFQDLMAAIEELLGSHALPAAQRLRCLLTASEILRGQGEALTIDRRTFYNHLYSALNQVALTPLTELDFLFNDDDDGGRKEQSKASQEATLMQHSAFMNDSALVPTLLARLLESMLLESKILDPARQAAFAKRAASTAGAAGDSGTSMGLMCVLQRLLRRHGKLRGMLENEAGGPAGGFKSYSAVIEDPAETGALSVPLWEISYLAAHYHPHVAQAAKEISNMNIAAATAAAASRGGGGGGGSGGGANSVLPLGSTAVDLAVQYSTVKGGFRPPPKAPLQTSKITKNPIQQGKASRARTAAQRRGALKPAAVAEFLLKLDDCSKDGGVGGGGADVVDEEEEEEEEGDVEAAFSRHYSVNRRFQRNAELREEHGVLSAKLRLFHEHLQAKHVAEEEERKRNDAAAAAVVAASSGAKEKKKKKEKKRKDKDEKKDEVKEKKSSDVKRQRQR